MTWCEAIVDLFCAIIGGGMTLLGVWLTIITQKKYENKIRVQNAKPYLYNSDDIMCDLNITMLPHSKNACKATVTGVFTNADNGICIIKKLISEKTEYYPIGCNVLNKGNSCKVEVKLENHIESLRDWKLFVEDIYGNEYCYEILNPEKINFKIGKLIQTF